MPSEDEKQQKIEAIQARLAQQERRTLLIMATVTSLALVTLGLLFFHILEVP